MIGKNLIHALGRVADFLDEDLLLVSGFIPLLNYKGSCASSAAAVDIRNSNNTSSYIFCAGIIKVYSTLDI